MEPFIGQIIMVGFNFAPRGFAFCDGQLLAINQNAALFSLLGTTFGGDGRTTFGLPDLRGRVPIHPGSGPGLTPRTWGQKSGSEKNTLVVANLPSHNHTVNIGVTDEDGDTNEANGNILSNTVNNNYNTGSPVSGQSLGGASTESAGGGTPVNNIQPFLGIYFCIALVGLFPSRN
jgi:microcystin-dependent protein